jgi:CheY-like chemotaxis protein
MPLKGLASMFGSINSTSCRSGRGNRYTCTISEIEMPHLGRSPGLGNFDRAGRSTAGCLSMRILIVDDDRDHAESIADVLVARQCEVDLAGSGEECVAKFREMPFELVFMDIKLPGMNGVEALFECKKIQPRAKIMLMTGFSLEQLVARGLTGGALGILRKPFLMKEIFDVLTQMESAESAGGVQTGPATISRKPGALH